MVFIVSKKNVLMISFIGEGVGMTNIDDYTTQVVFKYDLDSIKDMNLNGDLNIKIIYSKMMVNYTDDINGIWKFEFKTNGDQLKIDTKTINLNEEFELENGNKYILEKYTDNALG